MMAPCHYALQMLLKIIDKKSCKHLVGSMEMPKFALAFSKAHQLTLHLAQRVDLS